MNLRFYLPNCDGMEFHTRLIRGTSFSGACLEVCKLFFTFFTLLCTNFYLLNTFLCMNFSLLTTFLSMNINGKVSQNIQYME